MAERQLKVILIHDETSNADVRLSQVYQMIFDKIDVEAKKEKDKKSD